MVPSRLPVLCTGTVTTAPLNAVPSGSSPEPAPDCTSASPEKELEALRQELGHFDPSLLEKPYAIAFTKADLLGPEVQFADPFAGAEVPRFLISGVSGQGLRELVIWLGTLVKERRLLEAVPVVEQVDGAG